MTANPPKRTATAWFTAALFFAVLIFIPELVGIDGFDGGFAISFVSIVIAITAAVMGALYLSWAAKLDKILHGEGILAHWVYSPELWADYTKKEHEEEKTEKKGLFLLVTGIALFFGVVFWVFDEEAGFFVFLVMLGLIGLVAFAWQFSVWNNHRQNLGVGVKEAYITKDAVYMNRKLTTWRAPFTGFEEAFIDENGGLLLLVVKYTVTNRTGPQTYTIRVPIPLGQEETAGSVIQQINMASG